MVHHYFFTKRVKLEENKWKMLEVFDLKEDKEMNSILETLGKRMQDLEFDVENPTIQVEQGFVNVTYKAMLTNVMDNI